MKNKNLLLNFFLALAVLVFFQTSCNNTAENQENEADTLVEEEHVEEAGEHKAHWSYEGETGPEHWAEIVEGCSCGGTSQSPIDIVGATKDKTLKALNFTYPASTNVSLINNGHSVQVNYPEGEFIVNEVKYSLVQFHFHAGSENFINGKQFALEAHLVHVTPENQIAVIGLMIEEGKENAFLKAFWDKLPAEGTEEVKCEQKLDVNQFLPKNKSYYHFMGSLTTPPCTEGVSWFVFKNPIQASAEQIAKLSSLMPKNNFRPVQALNGRKVTEF